MFSRATMIAAVVCLCASSSVYAAGGGNSSGSAKSSEYKQAVKAIKKDNYPAAVELLNKVVDKDPDNEDAWNYLGYSLRNLQEFDGALAAYEKALQLEPEHKGALEYLGELYLNTGQPEKARVQLQKLDDACLLTCKEFRMLKKQIAGYEGGP
jgi:Flp pilus assembly protein TadD